jgi:hypothetical protein
LPRRGHVEAKPLRAVGDGAGRVHDGWRHL